MTTLEDYVEIPSDRVPFEQRPWMKGAEITDSVIEAIRENKYRFIRLNYPNGDMVGPYRRLPGHADRRGDGGSLPGPPHPGGAGDGGILVISADHGNADDMYEHAKKTGAVVVDAETGKIKVKTSHSLNPVPVYIYDPAGTAQLSLSARQGLGISSLAATCLRLLGFAPAGRLRPQRGRGWSGGDGRGGIGPERR